VGHVSIPSDNPILLARGLRPYETDPSVSLAVGDGEVVALTRETPTGDGADATPLLRCLAGAEAPSGGELWLKGVAVHTLRPAPRLRFSHTQCAVLPRVSRLLPELDLAENTALPLLLAGVGRVEARRHATQWLGRLAIEEFAAHRPTGLEPSVLRRAAIARSLVGDPTILLADEPVFELASADGFNLLRILRAVSGTYGLTVIAATTDPVVAEWADRRIPVAVGAPVVTELCEKVGSPA
jgi:putative ABC transport system ATP-binding protein